MKLYDPKIELPRINTRCLIFVRDDEIAIDVYWRGEYFEEYQEIYGEEQYSPKYVSYWTYWPELSDYEL